MQFNHLTSSPYYPQSNGEAERAVRTIKGLLKKCEDPYLALLFYRTTPIQGGKYSPSELLMNRLPRSTIPTTLEQRKPRIPDLSEVYVRDNREKNRQKQNYDLRHGVRKQRPLIRGEMVWLPDRRLDADAVCQNTSCPTKLHNDNSRWSFIQEEQKRHCTDS